MTASYEQSKIGRDRKMKRDRYRAILSSKEQIMVECKAASTAKFAKKLANFYLDLANEVLSLERSKSSAY